eukprot:gene8838-biopygen3162
MCNGQRPNVNGKTCKTAGFSVATAYSPTPASPEGTCRALAEPSGPVPLGLPSPCPICLSILFGQDLPSPDQFRANLSRAGRGLVEPKVSVRPDLPSPSRKSCRQVWPACLPPPCAAGAARPRRRPRAAAWGVVGGTGADGDGDGRRAA